MRALVSWSGGKDCFAALHDLRSDGAVVVQGLLSTFTPDPLRVAVHEVDAELVRRQAQALSLPLTTIHLPPAATNAAYEAALAPVIAAQRAEGVEAIVYGDLHLADIRAYRDAQAERMAVRALFPNWGRTPAAFARAVIAGGIKAVICSVDTDKLPLSFVGRAYDYALLADLPSYVDPCGENGEFHTFVYDGPGFAEPVQFASADVAIRGKVGFGPLFPT